MTMRAKAHGERELRLPGLRPGCIVALDPAGAHPELTLADHRKYRDWRKDELFLFLFEIENMRGHGAFVDRVGRVWWGMHLDDFRMATDEEV